jgi:hypothetical protein
MLSPRASRLLGIQPRFFRRRARHPAAGRLLTSPVAFFVAGMIDISWLLWIYARWRIAQRRERLSPPS